MTNQCTKVLSTIAETEGASGVDFEKNVIDPQPDWLFTVTQRRNKETD
jgi:hypothetical protein